jgi:hypothetical protein
LLTQLSDRKFDLTSPELRDNILQFYSDLSAAIEAKKDQIRWQGMQTELVLLKSAAPAPKGANGSAHRRPTDGVVVKRLSDTSLWFKTCVILRADNTTRLVEEYCSYVPPPIFVPTPSIQAGEIVDVRLSLGLKNANAVLAAPKLQQRKNR